MTGSPLGSMLVPLDGSPLAEQALPFAEHLAKATSARLVLCLVVAAGQGEEAGAEPPSERESIAYLQAQAQRLVDRGHRVEVVTPRGEPAAGILAEVRAADAGIVVMATHGRSGPGRWLYGSVADDVLRNAAVPVMIVPLGVAQPWPTDRPLSILVTLDGSDLAEAVLGPAEDLALRLGAEIALLQVVQFPPYSLFGDGSAYLAAFDPDEALREADRYLKEVAARLTRRSVRVLTELGLPPIAVAEVARREKSDLIAMATHGRSGLARLVLGSVATGALQRASVPLMLVRPPRSELREAAEDAAQEAHPTR